VGTYCAVVGLVGQGHRRRDHSNGNDSDKLEQGVATAQFPRGQLRRSVAEKLGSALKHKALFSPFRRWTADKSVQGCLYFIKM